LKLTRIARNIGAEIPLATSYSPHSFALRSKVLVNILKKTTTTTLNKFYPSAETM
jgi:hypothetical protein